MNLVWPKTLGSQSRFPCEPWYFILPWCCEGPGLASSLRGGPTKESRHMRPGAKSDAHQGKVGPGETNNYPERPGCGTAPAGEPSEGMGSLLIQILDITVLPLLKQAPRPGCQCLQITTCGPQKIARKENESSFAPGHRLSTASPSQSCRIEGRGA